MFLKLSVLVCISFHDIFEKSIYSPFKIDSDKYQFHFTLCPNTTVQIFNSLSKMSNRTEWMNSTGASAPTVASFYTVENV